MPTPARTGVLLVNLGTPDAPTPSAVRRYLAEFLADPRVVQIPRVVWLPILYLAILPFRPAKTARKYAAIWMADGSPLRVYLGKQVQLLRGYLGQSADKHLAGAVAGAMRYGNPSIASGLAELQSRGCERVLVLPLYPQYAGSTTGSTEDAVALAVARLKPAPQVRIVSDFHDHPAYARAIAKNVNDYWMKHGRPDRLLMSFHGLPKSIVAAGDPYQRQCLASAKLIAIELGWDDSRTLVTFQSRFGKAEWIQPYTTEVLDSLGAEKIGRVDVICPGFAADCLETLEEIAIEARDDFRSAGGKELHYIPTTNDTPAWMTALTTITLEKLRDWQDP